MPVRVALSSLVAIAVGMGGAQTQASVTQAHEPGAALPAVCSTGLSVLERAQTNTSMLLADGLITINGWVLRPTQMAWRARSPDNPVLAAVFHSD